MQTATQRGLQTLRYVIDPGASRFTVQAFATGLLSAFGHDPRIGIRDYEGQVQFVPETYEKAFLRLGLRTGALEVLEEMKSSDRKKLEQAMYGEVLDTARFPEAIYESREINVARLSAERLNARIAGDLSFHGITRTESLEAHVMLMGSTLHASGEFQLRQSDYGIKPVSFAAGTLRLKDEIKFKFEMVARRQD